MTSERRRLTFRVLGELEVLAEGAAIPLGGAKQRMLLALLLVERGQAISTDRLIDTLWSGSPPATAQKSIQVYVSGLRKALGENRILTRGRGYELVAESGEVDIDVFDTLVRDAAGAPPVSAASKLREALQLVRGRPLSDIALESWAAPQVARFEEQILAATEQRIEADLALGRHVELVPELEALVAANAYRERLLELLMLAFYRSGRQAEALHAYRRGASRLRDELGLEPGRPLRQLEASILRHDKALDAPAQSSRTPALAMRRRGWTVATAGALALVAAAVYAAAIALTRENSASLESLPPGVAIISIEDGSLVAHIPTSEITEPVEAVTDRESFWVWNLQPFSLVQVDPASGEVLKRIGSPFDGDAGWYLPAGKNIWFSGQELVRVDAASGRVVDRFRIAEARDALAWVTRCAGSLWVANEVEGQVVRVDPETGAVEARLPMASPWAVACGDGDLWVTSSTSGDVRRIDPASNRFVATAQVPPPHPSLALGGGYAWTTNETNGTLYKIDRRGTIVATYQTGDGARQLSYDAGTVWVANQDAGTVTGVDAATGAEQSFKFGHPIQSVAALQGRLLVELLPGPTFDDRIRNLEGRVAKLIAPTYAFDPPDPALAWNPWISLAERSTCAQLLRHPVGDGLDGDELVPDLASTMPLVSADGLTYRFTVAAGRRFAPPSNGPVTAAAVRFSIERALSPKLGSDLPGMRFLADVAGASDFNSGKTRHVRGIRVRGENISFTLVRRSADFLERLSLPFFCTVPTGTPLLEGGVTTVAPPSAGPYYHSDGFNGEYQILKRNPNYAGPRRGKLDAIAFREGISPEHAVARVRSGEWDGAILFDDLLAPDGVVAREARASDGRFRTEELPIRGTAYPSEKGSLHALFSSRLGCDPINGVFDLASLCIRER